MLVCCVCGREFERAGSRGRVPKTCGQRCRKRLSRGAGNPLGVDGRWVRAVGKRPLRVDGSGFASSTDPSSWCSWSEVRRSSVGDGFGVMLGGGLGCYDFDHALVGGVLKPWAEQVLGGIRERVLFSEVSLSGEGLHVFVEAPESAVRRWGFPDGHVEMFSRQRFIRMTGDRFRLPGM